jgi:hypothetical protein
VKNHLNATCVIILVALKIVLLDMKEFTWVKNHTNVTCVIMYAALNLILIDMKKFIQVM